MIILASGSNRRIELLKDAGVQFRVIPSLVEEDFSNDLSPEENVKQVALKKAVDIFSKNKDSFVIAADTIVVYNNEIFGKPTDEDDAFNILKRLSNKTHKVMTAVAILKEGVEDVFLSTTKVTFKDLSDEEIWEYVDTKEPFGKAGAYAIQGIGKDIVDTFDGCFFTVVGLPLKEVLNRINKYTKTPQEWGVLT